MRVLVLWFRLWQKAGSVWRRMVDRVWECSELRRMGVCGAGTRLTARSTFTGHSGIRLGSNVHIGCGAFIRGNGGLEIGDNTHISRNLVLYTVNHRYEGTCLPYDRTQVEKAVHIGKNVWIGMNVKITPGVTIGDGAIVGMGAVVAKDVPPLAIVGGAPAEVIGWRDRDHYDRLEQAGLYGGRGGRPLGGVE